MIAMWFLPPPADKPQDEAKRAWGVMREIEPPPSMLVDPDADEEEVRVRYESWRELGRSVGEAARRAEAYDRLERELRRL